MMMMMMTMESEETTSYGCNFSSKVYKVHNQEDNYMTKLHIKGINKGSAEPREVQTCLWPKI